MNELQVLIENIRSAMSFPDTVPLDTIRRYAQRYAEACKTLNDRMLQCIQHIRAGNVAEGIRMAEVTPNLQEMYSTLDISDRDGWDEIVSTLGYDQASPLPSAFSLELNDAYLKLAPLEPLLRQHRLYALAGAPIRERLFVLRAIAKTDPENTFWRTDQENFEKFRIREMNNEVRQAVATKHAPTIRSLHAELSTPDWIVPPPREYRQQLAISALQDYANTLMQHFSAYDYDQARKTYAAMQQILAAERIGMPPAIQAQIRAAVQWLAEEKDQENAKAEFNRAVEDLRNALEEETPLPTLEHLYYALATVASQAGRSIPQELDYLYQSQVNRIHTSATRRNQMIIIAVVAVCVLLGGLLAWSLYQQLHAGQVQDTLVSLNQIADEKRFDDITETIDSIEKNSPEIAKHAEVTAAIQRLRRMWDEDQKRAAEFKRYHDQADAQLSVPDKPNATELGKIRTSVEQAEKLSRTSEEKALYTELKRKFDSVFTAKQRDINQEYTEALDAISEEYNALKRNTNLAPSESIAQAKELAQRLRRLQNTPEVAPSLLEKGKETEELIANHQKKTENAQDQDTALKNLFTKAPNWEDYQLALKQFVVDFPDHPATKDVGNVVLELPGIKDPYTLLHDIAKTYSGANGSFESLQKNSASLLKKYQEFSSKISGASPQSVFSPGDSLEEMAKMLPYTSSSLAATESRLKDISRQEVFPWVHDDGKWYYLTKKPDGDGAYRYITTFASEEKSWRIKSFDAAKVPVVTQYDFARTSQRRIDQIRDNAETVVCSILIDLLQKPKGAAPGIDPILQCILAETLITDISKIDPFFATQFKKVLEIVQKSGVDSLTEWMDVGSKNVEDQRKLAQTAISRLPDINHLRDNVIRERGDFKRTLAKFEPRCDWIGNLTKRDGQWFCIPISGVLTDGTGDLYVFRQNAGQPTVRPIKIGRVSSGKFEIQSNTSSLMQCLPVFRIQH